MLERVLMMRKYYKKHSREAAAMEKQYVDTYGDELGIFAGNDNPLDLSQHIVPESGSD